MSKTSDISDLIRNRRTIHDFIPGKLPDKKIIKQAFELAQYAPNHHLTEPWHFYLLGQETKEAICQLNYELMQSTKGQQAAEKKLSRWRDIPGWAMVSCDHSDDEIQQQEDYAAVACAIQNFSLFLWQHGIGCKWSTGPVIRDPGFYELTWVDSAREFIVALIWYGYPKEIPTVNRSGINTCMIELP